MKIEINTKKIKEIKLGEEKYPKKLEHIYAKPQNLYVLGNEKLLDEKSIAIIVPKVEH